MRTGSTPGQLLESLGDLMADLFNRDERVLDGHRALRNAPGTKPEITHLGETILGETILLLPACDGRPEICPTLFPTVLRVQQALCGLGRKIIR